ncbi:MAG: hypothetical protein Q8M03_06885, partial [Legionella sp.]|nr:hypothetical protein [Legionella sp.]
MSTPNSADSHAAADIELAKSVEQRRELTHELQEARDEIVLLRDQLTVANHRITDLSEELGAFRAEAANNASLPPGVSEYIQSISSSAPRSIAELKST